MQKKRKTAALLIALAIMLCMPQSLAREEIQQVFAYEDGIARFVSSEGKMGLLDKEGKIIAPAIYEYIDVFDENGIAITTICEGGEPLRGLIDRQGRRIAENRYQTIMRHQRNELGCSAQYGTYRAEINGEETALFADGTSAVYPSPSLSEQIPNASAINRDAFFVQGSVFWFTEDGWKLFDKKGNPLNEDSWKYYVPFPNGGGAVNKDGLWGVVSADGRLVVDYSYTGWPEYTPYGIIVSANEEATNRKKYGVISFTGEEILPLHYVDISTFSEGYAACALDGKYGYVDKDFHWKLEPQWLGAGPFSAGIAVVKQDGFICLIDKEGKTILGFDDEALEGKSIYWDEYIVVGDNEKGIMTLYDREGAAVWTCENIRVPHLMEQNGNMLRIYSFYDGEAQYGYLNLATGKMAITPQFCSAEDFADGFAIVRPSDAQGFGVIDTEGNYVIAPEYETISWVWGCGGVWFEANKETENTFDSYTFNRYGELIIHSHCEHPSNG